MLTKQSYNGIPAELTLKKAEEWVRPRISEKRFNHVRGVAEVARQLAEEAGCDAFLAELAGWLHDACKETKDRDLVIQAMQFGLQLTALEKMSGYLLHGPVGAETVKQDLGLTNELVLNAIREHTLGAVDMTPLSQVVFLADCLESSRPADYTDPIWAALYHGHSRKKAKKSGDPIDLDNAILVASDLGLRQLLDSGRVIHPRTVDVRNFYLNRVRDRSKPA